MDEQFSGNIEQSAARLAEVAEKVPDFEPHGNEGEEQHQRPEVELTTRSDELDRRQAEFEAQRRELENQRAQVERELSERAQAMDRVQAELEADWAALERDRRQWEQHRGSESPQGEPQPREQDPHRDGDSNQESASHAEHAEAAAGNPPQHEQGPTDQAELMKRIYAMVEATAEQEDCEADPHEPAANDVHPTTDVAEQPSPPVEEEGDDESIQSYMADLLERVGGKSSTSPKSAASNPKPRVAPTAAVTQGGEAAPAEVTPEEPFEWTPRAQAAEIPSDLAAMRDLANSAARQAIDHSAHRRWVQAAWAKLGVSVLALICSAFLYLQAPDDVGVGFLGASVALVVAILWAVQAGTLFQGMALARRNRPQDKS